MANKIVVRRIEEEVATENPQGEEIHKKEGSNVQPVHSFGGTFSVLNSKVDDEALEGISTPTTKMVNTNGVISMTQVEDKVGEVEMEEVSYDDWEKSQESELSKGNITSAKLVDELVGKTVEVASKILESLKGSGKITEFRIIPIGSPGTMDFQPGRVQVLKDHSGKIVDVEIS